MYCNSDQLTYEVDEYSIVAIWAMAELCLGIIATNLALSRFVYHYYFNRDDGSRQNNSQKQSYAYGSRSRSGYTQHPVPPTSNLPFPRPAKAERRETRTAGSEDSDVPLKPIRGIEKTTEIDMRVSQKN
jgi:hypothetical protein